MSAVPEPATEANPSDAVAALELRDITAAYGRTVVVRDASLRVPERGLVALLGPNGAGKTTLLRIAAGLMRPRQGDVHVLGADMTTSSPSERAKRGLCLIPEGRGIFRTLSVRENLVLHTPPWSRKDSIEQAIDAFPVLGDRLKQTAGSLSGGEQQMLALARVFLAQPKVVLLDEVSMGLAPIVVEQIFESLQRLTDQGIALLLVEQYVNRALEMCDYAYLINRGVITFGGRPEELDEGAVVEGYLGADILHVGNGLGSE